MTHLIRLSSPGVSVSVANFARRGALRWPLLAAALVCALAGCGSEPATEDETQADTGELLPWAVGNNWTYEVTDADGLVTQKTQTIGELEVVPGWSDDDSVKANRVETRKGTDEADKTVSWQAPDPEAKERIVRYREESYGAKSGDLSLVELWHPARLRVDGRADYTIKDTQFPISYKEIKLPDGLEDEKTEHGVTELWTVRGPEPVKAGGKNYPKAILIQKVSGSGDLKSYWFVRGVGKVKESGSSQTEELTSYEVEP